MTKASDGCIFIACDWQDLAEGAEVTSMLEAKGLSVWAGPRDAGTGDPAQYAAATRDAATRCSAFVLLLSGRPVDLAALGELTCLAEAAGKPIYPVRVTEQAFVPDFPSLQRAKSWIDATGSRREAELGRLAAELQSAARPVAAPAAPAWQAPAPSAAAWQAPAAPAQASAWNRAGGQRAGQPKWMSALWLVVAIILLLGGVARIFSALG